LVHEAALRAAPWWEPWLSMAVAAGTVAAAVYAAKAAKAALTSTAVAQRSLDVAADTLKVAETAAALDQVRAFSQEFEQKQYFIRFWTLDMATRDVTGIEHLDTKLAIYPKHPYALCLRATVPEDDKPFSDAARGTLEAAVKELNAGQFIDDALGPPWSRDRADMYSLYYFALRLASFCGLDGTAVPDPERVRMLNGNFGTQLILTLASHRRLAARLFRGPGLEDYYFEHYRHFYGLRNMTYSRLVDGLVFDAYAHGLLTEVHRSELTKTEFYLSSHPANDPMRVEPFDPSRFAPPVAGTDESVPPSEDDLPQ